MMPDAALVSNLGQYIERLSSRHSIFYQQQWSNPMESGDPDTGPNLGARSRLVLNAFGGLEP